MPQVQRAPIGIFDSGYGGLTILRAIRALLPDYDYIYLGDNARAPYGPRSFEIVYEFTRQAVGTLLQMGCPLVILGCNTASAKALRTIQQHDLPLWRKTSNLHRLTSNINALGIIRPTAEAIGTITETRHVGLLATEGTVRSRSYELEAAKLWPDITLTSQACPLWAALVEAGETHSEGTRYFVEKNIRQLLERDPAIDTIILGCTHYPLLLDLIREIVPSSITLLSQEQYVARSLQDYLARHNEYAGQLRRGASCQYLTTENPERFAENARIFLDQSVEAQHILLQQLAE